jgi:hypothetical protein
MALSRLPSIATPAPTEADMRCPVCKGTKIIMLGGESYPCPTCSGTGNLWLKYWTEPERAGLKAMGRYLRSSDIQFVQMMKPCHVAKLIVAQNMIMRFVAAARKAKGE